MVFVMTGACGTAGGVAAVNVQVLRAIVELAETAQLDLSVLSLAEQPWDRPPFLPPSVEFHAFAGRKNALARAMLRRAVSRPIFFFDFVRLAVPVLPLAVARWLSTIVFAHGHDYWLEIRLASRLILKSASLVLTNSHFTLKKMQAALGPIRAVACPLGLPDQFPFNGQLSPKPAEPLELRACDDTTRPLGERVLLLVGRIDSRERGKGHDSMLAVLPRLLERFPDTQLVFAGPGDDHERLATVALQRGVGHAVLIPGYGGPERLAALYQQCYAFTMPSRQEGFGLVYLEAMNFGKPCVGCWEDGAEDVIVHGETGYLIRNPLDLDELATAVSNLLQDPAAARDMGRRGFKRLQSNFTAEHFRARLSASIESFLQSKR